MHWLIPLAATTGPVSATVHVSDSSAHEESLRQLDSLYKSSPVMQKHVDIHLVYDSFDRQFNMWRNIAKFFARTEVCGARTVSFCPCLA